MLRDTYPDMPTLLSAIRRRPGMFLGTTSITNLHLMLGGIDFAEDFHNIPESERLGGFDFVAFEQWVASMFNPNRLSLNSFSLASYLTNSETEGFTVWFEWFDRFVTEIANRSDEAKMLG